MRSPDIGKCTRRAVRRQNRSVKCGRLSGYQRHGAALLNTKVKNFHGSRGLLAGTPQCSALLGGQAQLVEESTIAFSCGVQQPLKRDDLDIAFEVWVVAEVA